MPDLTSAYAAQTSIDRVRRRVGALGLFAITLFASIGLLGGVHVVLAEGRRGDAIWLLVVAGTISLVVTVLIRTIIQRNALSPLWLAASLCPAMVAAIWML
ncbi:MAG: hypothetical protein Q7T56_09035 [Nocardioidaceae bacterium]|nr:hypothetical protein [Nocardioidaceae bacterium]